MKQIISWLEIAPEILEKIKNLSVRDISEPIKLEGGYYIFQIQDLRREPITDFNLKDQHERFRQILYYRKLKDEAGKYVVSVMQPKNVVTNGITLYELTKVYMAWKQDTTKLKFSDFVIEQSNNLLSKSLVTFSQEDWNVLDFLKKFDPTKIDSKIFNKEKIGGEISKQIALQVRDEVLTKLALENNLDKNENVQKQMKEWRDKWTYDETRRFYLKKSMVSDEDAEKYFNKNIKFFQINFDEPPMYEDYKNTAKRFAYIHQAENILIKKIDTLKEKYPININMAVLDTITTIDFEKSRWQSLQVFKRSTNRLAVPIVDPAWKIQ